jgi:hypothetical protein
MKNSAESYLYGLIITFIILVYLIYQAYWPWFKPLEWRKRKSIFRRKFKNDWLFMPQNINLRLLERHPTFDLWYARLGPLVVIVLVLAMLIFLYSNLRIEMMP